MCQKIKMTSKALGKATICDLIPNMDKKEQELLGLRNDFVKVVRLEHVFMYFRNRYKDDSTDFQDQVSYSENKYINDSKKVLKRIKDIFECLDYIKKTHDELRSVCDKVYKALEEKNVSIFNEDNVEDVDGDSIANQLAVDPNSKNFVPETLPVDADPTKLEVNSVIIPETEKIDVNSKHYAPSTCVVDNDLQGSLTQTNF